MPSARAEADTQCRLVLGDPVVVDPRIRASLAADEALEIVRPAEDGLLRTVDLLAQPSMFSARRVVWIKGFKLQTSEGEVGKTRSAEKAQEELEVFLGVLEAGFDRNVRLVVSAAKIDRRSRAYKFFQKRNAVDDMNLKCEPNGRLREADVARLVAERVKAAGLKPFSSAVVAAICKRTGGEVGLLLAEVDKLCLYAATIGAPDARVAAELMSDYAGAWVFDLTNALGARDSVEAFRVLRELLAAGESPYRLASMLATRVAALLEARRAIAHLPPGWEGKAAGVFLKSFLPRVPEPLASRFPANYGTYYVFRDAASFSEGGLRRLHRSLLALDRTLKRSAGAPGAAVEAVLEEACLGA